MERARKYEGSCHCGKVKYRAEMDLEGAITCNCSNCSRRGWILKFVPEKQFELLSGKDDLTDYQFNKRHIHHVFCKHCGVSSFSHGKGKDGTTTYSVNVRCLEGVDPSQVKTTEYNGKEI